MPITEGQNSAPEAVGQPTPMQPIGYQKQEQSMEPVTQGTELEMKNVTEQSVQTLSATEVTLTQPSFNTTYLFPSKIVCQQTKANPLTSKLEDNLKPDRDIIPAVLSFLDHRTIYTITRLINREWNKLAQTKYLTQQVEVQRWKEKCEQHPEYQTGSLTRLLLAASLAEREEGESAALSVDAKQSDEVLKQYCRARDQATLCIESITAIYRQLKIRDLPKNVACIEAMQEQFYKDMKPPQLTEKLNALIKIVRDFQKSLKEKHPQHWGLLGVSLTNETKMECLPNVEGYQFIHEFLCQMASITGILSDIVIVQIIMQEILRTDQIEHDTLESQLIFQERLMRLARSSPFFATTTSNVLLLLANLNPCLLQFFWQNVELHSHVKKLTTQDWIFVSRYNSAMPLRILNGILNFPLINQLFTSSDYIALAKNNPNTALSDERISLILKNERAVTILENNDLISLLEFFWDSIAQTLINNPRLEKKMTVELWMKLAETSAPYIQVIAKNPSIHAKFSPQQLIQLMKKYASTREILLSQPEVISKLFQATSEQLAILITGDPLVEGILLRYPKFIGKLIELSPESLAKLIIDRLDVSKVLLAHAGVVEKIQGLLARDEVEKLQRRVRDLPAAAANVRQLRAKQEFNVVYSSPFTPEDTLGYGYVNSTAVSYRPMVESSNSSPSNQSSYALTLDRTSRNWTNGRKIALGVLGVLFIAGLALTISGIGAAVGINILFVTKSIAWYCFGAGIGDMLLAGFFAYNNYPPLVTHYKKVPIEQPVSSIASSLIPAGQRKEEKTTQPRLQLEVKEVGDQRNSPVPAWKKDASASTHQLLQKAPVNWTTLHKAAQITEASASTTEASATSLSDALRASQPSVSSFAEMKYQPGS